MLRKFLTSIATAIFVVMLGFGSTTPASAQSVSGKWCAKNVAEWGHVLTLSQNGESVTGTLKAKKGPQNENATVISSKFSKGTWEIKLDTGVLLTVSLKDGHLRGKYLRGWSPANASYRRC